jgi:hypothetical protein
VKEKTVDDEVSEEPVTGLGRRASMGRIRMAEKREIARALKEANDLLGPIQVCPFTNAYLRSSCVLCSCIDRKKV